MSFQSTRKMGRVGLDARDLASLVRLELMNGSAPSTDSKGERCFIFFCFLTIPRNARDRRSLSVCTETRVWCQCQFVRVYRDESLVPVSVCPCVTRRELGASVSLSVCSETRAWCQCQFVRV